MAKSVFSKDQNDYINSNCITVSDPFVTLSLGGDNLFAFRNFPLCSLK